MSFWMSFIIVIDCKSELFVNKINVEPKGFSFRVAYGGHHGVG